MPFKDANGRYFCESCAQRYSGRGECCLECEGEPLLDLADEDVRQMIREFDEARWRKRSTQWTFLSIALVSPLGIGLMWVLSAMASLTVWGVAAASLSTILITRFSPEPKLPELAAEDLRDLEAHRTPPGN
jgi:hypothetical protein